MNRKIPYLDDEETELLNEIEQGEWQPQPLTANALTQYQTAAQHHHALHEKRQTTIRFSTSDLAVLKARSKVLGIGYQNIIQALVHNYVEGKITLEL